MNEKNNIVPDDEEFIRGMMQEARMKAPENLKYRIINVKCLKMNNLGVM